MAIDEGNNNTRHDDNIDEKEDRQTLVECCHS